MQVGPCGAVIGLAICRPMIAPASARVTSAHGRSPEPATADGSAPVVPVSVPFSPLAFWTVRLAWTGSPEATLRLGAAPTTSGAREAPAAAGAPAGAWAPGAPPVPPVPADGLPSTLAETAAPPPSPCAAPPPDDEPPQP